MSLLGVNDIHLSFGGAALLQGVKLHIHEGDRLVLLGRNGCGKSTFLRILSGQQSPDRGERALTGGARVAWLDQDIPVDLKGRAADVAAVDHVDEHILERYFTQLDVDGEAEFATMSGGQRRRVLLARALSHQAEILILDEPTNHLDVESIVWLEGELVARRGALVMVTHDRAFANRVSNRTAEIDRGQLCVFDCGYGRFVERRAALLEDEARGVQEFEKKLALEEIWIRRGVKARRVRDEGRVKALEAMREQKKMRREVQGTAKMNLVHSGKSGDLVLEMKDVSFNYPNSPALVSNAELLLERGDRVGVVGANGSGKTTLLRLMLGQLSPTHGSVKLGTKLEVLYLDQLRDQLDPRLSVSQNLAGKDDHVMVGGQLRHINAYLADFLFDSERARSPVHILSGGERNRLLLAKLFTKAANVLVLDEPTNDLDMETLELLEDLVASFKGTVLVVSHDREFLNNTVGSTLWLENGTLRQCVGDWEDRQALLQREAAAKTRDVKAAKAAAQASGAEKKVKLSFKEQRELSELPEKLALLEAKIEGLQQSLSDPELYKQGVDAASKLTKELTDLEATVATGLARWQNLEDKNQA